MKKPEPNSAPTHATVEVIPGERLLNVKQVSEITGMAVATLNRARIYGTDAPPWVKIGKSTRYRSSSVQAWITNKTEYQHTSAQQQAA